MTLALSKKKHLGTQRKKGILYINLCYKAV